jgi:hypothetical protein
MATRFHLGSSRGGYAPASLTCVVTVLVALRAIH